MNEKLIDPILMDKYVDLGDCELQISFFVEEKWVDYNYGYPDLKQTINEALNKMIQKSVNKESKQIHISPATKLEKTIANLQNAFQNIEDFQLVLDKIELKGRFVNYENEPVLDNIRVLG